MYRAWMEIKKGCKRRGEVGEVDAERVGVGVDEDTGEHSEGMCKEEDEVGWGGKKRKGGKKK